MMDFVKTDAYLKLLSGTESYKTLTPEEQVSYVFTAYERLSLYYAESLLTPKVVALQTLYMTKSLSVEGEEAEAIQKIRRTGATSYSVDGVSVSFGDADSGIGIAPDVLAYFELLETQKKRARVGRLI
ncbi:hypothetical protein [Sporosarcina sp. A2]|uniref:hypothetical protein n=1 Tax=Sporosarcina sp. A2 TaxID=3393449 RepID=UPI003D79AB2D